MRLIRRFSVFVPVFGGASYARKYTVLLFHSLQLIQYSSGIEDMKCPN